MPTATVKMTLTDGDTAPQGSAPSQVPLTFSLAYTESSCKIVQISAGQVDFPVTLDTVGAPKLIFMRSIVTDIDVKLSDGLVVTPTPTKLAEAGGWILLANPNGQNIKQFLITTPASPTTGARIEIRSYE